VIDRDALIDLQAVIGGSRADLEELISDFIVDAPVQLAQMARAAAESELLAVRLGAHSLKSNARDLGAMTFAKLCADLESDLHTPGFVGDLPLRVSEISALWPEVCAALEAEIIRSEAGL
jgi:HPt (histidine-containing phosphotransfer) domain-containing protein